jgi:hypothetical protein
MAMCGGMHELQGTSHINMWEEKIHLKCKVVQAPVAHAQNPSYSGGWDQEGLGLRSAQANSFWDPNSKNRLEMWPKQYISALQGQSPTFKP